MNVISVEHLSKAYRLGQIGTPSRESAFAGRTAGMFPPSGTMRHGSTQAFANDLKLWWAKARGTSGQSIAKDRRDRSWQQNKDVYDMVWPVVQ